MVWSDKEYFPDARCFRFMNDHQLKISRIFRFSSHMKMPSKHTVSFLFCILKGIITGNEFNGFDIKKNKKGAATSLSCKNQSLSLTLTLGYENTGADVSK